MKRFHPSTHAASWALVLGLGLAAASQAQAQFAKPDDAIKYRKSTLSVMGTHFGRLGAMAQGKVPFDAKAAEANAVLVSTLAALPFSVAAGGPFAPGTDKGDTRAKPEIWTETDKFQQSTKTMNDAVGKLLLATRSGKEADFKAAFAEAGKSCKGCHEAFRKD